jgi:carbon-monoxide dehydrogenase large subunit
LSGIGHPVLRREDHALLLGKGCFMDDLNEPDQLHVWFVRSTYAHATFGSIDTHAAKQVPGVKAVYVGTDLIDESVGMLQGSSPLLNKDGTSIYIPPWPAMALDTARYAGDTVAMVVAETRDAARDAAELVDIDYIELESVTDLRRAADSAAVQIWPDCANNMALDWERGDQDATQSVFSDAAHVISVELVQNRVVVAAMETRGVLASYDVETDEYLVRTPTQGVAMVQEPLAKSLDVPIERVRVTTPDVGGAFGIKASLYPEQVLCALAARKLCRPLKWFAERGDSFLADYHARDHIMRGELALDETGRFLGICATVQSNMGAYLHGPAPVIPTNGGTRLLSNVYKIADYYASTQCVFTNTVPIGAYRGAGKPEFAHLVELLVDSAAHELGIDPATLRRKNMISPHELPYDTPQGLSYDSGDFELAMDMALRMGEVADVEQRRQAARRRGRRLGFGFAVYTEPDGFMDNRVTMSFDANGALQVTTTGQTGGQGYETVFAQIANSLLGVPPDDIELVQGDSARVGLGKGTGGSRVTTVSGAGMHECSASIIEQGKLIASHLLQAEIDGIEFEAGRFNVIGSERGLNIQEVARAASDSSQLPEGMPTGLSAEKHYVASEYCYPSGCHVCEVEVDVDTGFVEIVRYVQLSDFGTVINPMLLEGQIHGGVAQGIGQVLYEDAVYDSESGQLLSGSFMDYCLPRATQLPTYQCERLETWCKTNPLGVKGCGECGTTGSLPAVMNAVRDALIDCELHGFNMPLTPEKVWRVLSSQRQTS